MPAMPDQRPTLEYGRAEPRKRDWNFWVGWFALAFIVFDLLLLVFVALVFP